MARKKKADKATPVESVKHKDKRSNIPTEELRDFVKEDENQPKTILYPRDPSLDPQLVWKGKDEQDQQDLAVPSVPIYIQEKIHPQTIIEDVRRTVRKEVPAQFTLFADFNGLEFEEMIDFYRHGANWSNRMILGDSLYVMTSLAEKEGLKGQVQMIYIDPPYGIQFKSNWQVSTRKRDVKDGKAVDVTRQPEQIRAFRDTWKLGIHSYLAYLRDRLVVARELLTETGSVLVQIGDENVHLVRCLVDEVFGSENAVVTICFKKKAYQEAAALAPVNDYILWYAKSRDAVKYRSLLAPNEFDDNVGKYRKIVAPGGEAESSLQLNEKAIRTKLKEGWRLMRDDYPIVSQDPPPNPQPFEFEGCVYEPTPGRHWSQQYPEGMQRLGNAGRLRATGVRLYAVVFWEDSPSIPLSNFWDALKGPADPIYVVQTTTEVVQRCLLMTTDPGDLVLDPTCGSGTTAYVAEQWGRRWITIDTSRVALALARTRLMAAKYPYYYLADSPEGIKKEAEITGKMPPRRMI
jgi:adenine-specific DNA-methyltransferase